MTKRKEEIADAMTREMGKPLTETRGDVQEGIEEGRAPELQIPIDYGNDDYLVPDRIVRNAIQINGLRVKFRFEEL